MSHAAIYTVKRSILYYDPTHPWSNRTQHSATGVESAAPCRPQPCMLVQSRGATQQKKRCVFFFQKNSLTHKKKRRAEHCGLSSRAVGDQGPFCHVCQTPVSTHTPRATASTESGDSSSSITTISSKRTDYRETAKTRACV